MPSIGDCMITSLSVNDLVSFRDATTNNQHIISVTDALLLAEIEKSNTKGGHAASVITFTDSVHLHFGKKIEGIYDTLIFHEHAGRLTIAAFNDYLILFDGARTVLGRNILETLSLIETVGHSSGPIGQDSIAFLEAIIMNMSRPQPISDTLTMKDFAICYKVDPYYYGIPLGVLIPGA
jgi:hypothetical protein